MLSRHRPAVARSMRALWYSAKSALAGEVRAVNLPEIRLAETAKLGFERCILPEQNRQRLSQYRHVLTARARIKK